MSTCPSAARPSRRNRNSAFECRTSGPSSALPSRKTVTASSNATPCFAVLASAFRESHSNTYSVYTECRSIELRDIADKLEVFRVPSSSAERRLGEREREPAADRRCDR